MSADGTTLSSTGPDETGAEPIRADRLPLLAFVRDRETENVLREVLADVMPEGATIRRGDITAARAALQKMPTPGVLILDVAEEANPLLALDDVAQFVEPGARVLVIADRQDMNFYRELTRGLGVLECLYKPLNRDMVARYFGPLIAGRSPGETNVRGGRVVAVTGVRGGVGATTIAVNVATHLADKGHHHTLLMDADLHGGTAALMLSAETGQGLRMALENPDRADELFLERAAHQLSDRLHVLAAEENLNFLPRIQQGAARQLLDVVRRRYNRIIVDVPRHPSLLANEIYDLAHQRIVVMDLSLASIRDTLRQLAAPRGAAQSMRPILVMNLVGAPGMLSQKQVVDALGMTPDFVIPWMPKQIRPAATMGEPALKGARRFRAAIAAIAHEVASTGPVEEDASKAKRRSLFGRLFRR